MKKLIVLVIMVSVFGIVGCGKIEDTTVKSSDMELVTEYVNHELGEGDYDIDIYESTDNHIRFIAQKVGDDYNRYQGIYVRWTYTERIYES